MPKKHPIHPLAAGLGKAGSALVLQVVEDLRAASLEPDARDAALIRTAGELRDRMDELQAAVDADGLVSHTAAGAPKLHPAAGELRQHAVALSRVLGAVALSDTSGSRKVSARHQRAAAVRWSRG